MRGGRLNQMKVLTSQVSDPSGTKLSEFYLALCPSQHLCHQPKYFLYFLYICRNKLPVSRILPDTNMESSPSWTVWLNKILTSTYAGVDHNLPGNGGPECTHFLTVDQKLTETFLFTLFALLELYVAKSRVKLPAKIPVAERGFDRTGKKILLVAHTLTFGIELGYKLSTRQTIFLLNPCHVVTMMQVRIVLQTS